MRLPRSLIALALVALPAVASAQTSPPPPDREAIEKIVREYLMKNPEVIIEAVQELEKRQASARDQASQQAISQRKAELISDPGTPVGGNPDGDVTIVEFFDYHCGYCKRAHPTMQSVVKADSKIRIAYKQMPILTPNSRVAAAGALAAARQGKYMEMHNALMEARGELTKDRVIQIAAGIKLDTAKLEKDMAAPEIAQQIDRSLELAKALGIDGTPAFVIGNKLIPGAVDASTIRAAVADARKG
ncbi:DsbA family protein [Vineibacter terrae]|uniref:DsbA family protein n=1 Tax=Vineibacter terrae TaxID=2586908 RepID=UPI002E36EE2D|nr:DsbA family protein [Vineibacter terrae]HEX2889432.1 DsbA family protein [Vineibacter terrae]